MSGPVSRLHRAGRTLWRHRVVAVPALFAVSLTASASGISLIRIQPGDTLTALAARYHTTVARLVALNNLPGDGDLIYAGRTLRVPGAGSGTGSSSGSSSTGGTAVTSYVVRPGDTLSGIAARFHVSQARIARRNSLPSSLMVRIGQRLVIAHRVASTAAAPSTGGTGTAAALHDRAVLASRWEPTRDAVAALIRSTATAWGVDPRLALGISYQESGFNMRVVSGVDAIGAMQVMPYTARYLAADVVHRSLDLYDARDNVTAGVALLKVLTSAASSEAQAVAGYYQGLQSVRDHGMLPSTRQYVRDVLALKGRF